jgi:hypothetical protein
MRREMIRTQWYEANASARWGIGIEHWTINGRDIAGHGGLLLGFAPRLAFDMERRRGVVILNNAIDAPAVSMMPAVLTALENVDTADLGDGGARPEDADRFVGRYGFAWGETVIARLGDALVGVSLDREDLLQRADVLRVINEHEVAVVDGAFGSHVGQTIAVNFDDNGTPETMNYGSYFAHWVGPLLPQEQ